MKNQPADGWRFRSTLYIQNRRNSVKLTKRNQPYTVSPNPPFIITLILGREGQPVFPYVMIIFGFGQVVCRTPLAPTFVKPHYKFNGRAIPFAGITGKCICRWLYIERGCLVLSGAVATKRALLQSVPVKLKARFLFNNFFYADFLDFTRGWVPHLFR